MRTVAIVQARLGSTRLPWKMLLPLAGAPLIQRVLERVRRAKGLDDVVLAIPLSDISHAFQQAAVAADCNLFAPRCGEADLIQRHIKTAAAYAADLIVRIPGDNPCVDPQVIDDAIAYYRSKPLVWYSNTTIKLGAYWTDGLGCEVSSLSRWRWLEERTRDIAAYREHPHRYFYDRFRETMTEAIAIEGFFHAPEASRLDVNTREDYDRIAKLYETLYARNTQFTAADMADYFKEVPYADQQSAAHGTKSGGSP